MNAKELRDLFSKYARKHPQDLYGTLMGICRETWTQGTAEEWSRTILVGEGSGTGQADVTALFVRDLCGGRIMASPLGQPGSNHYFNRLANGEGYADYDLTGPDNGISRADAVKDAVELPDGDAAYDIMDPDAGPRYQLFLERAAAFMQRRLG